MLEKTCTNCKFLGHSSSNSPCVNCNRTEKNEFVAISKADRIRRMSDNELSEFLFDIIANSFDYANKWRFSENCLQWLQEECEVQDEV